jgi:uncharacterized protein YabE (DUF348 family)
VLASEQVKFGARDLVAPDLDSSVRDGEQIVVRYARPLTVRVDGVARTYWTTELTVDRALVALGIRSAGARVSTSRSEPLGRRGLDVLVSTAKKVRLVADGGTWNLTTTAATAAELLAERHLVPGPIDTLSVRLGAPIVSGQAIVLTRIDREQYSTTGSVPFGTVTESSSGLAAGVQRTTTPGRAGSTRSVYDVVRADGVVVSRRLVSSVIHEQPVAQVVQVGTHAAAQAQAQAAPASSGGGSGSVSAGSDSLNWAALARCESGGNPAAVNPAGYYGLYQFSPSTWRSVGGSGMPSAASAAEQLNRARILYQRDGAGQWSCGSHLFD